MDHMSDINCSLICAVRDGRVEEARELIRSYGLSYSKPWAEGYVLLCDSIKNGHKEVTKLLLMSGCKVNRNNKRKQTTCGTALHLAVQNGDTEIVKMLLDRDAQINAVNKLGSTPLHEAIISNKIKITQLLLKYNANVNAIDNIGLSPLHTAIMCNHAKIVKLLLNHGANVDDQNKDGKTVLHLAVEKGNLQIIEHILKYQPNINNKSNKSCINVAVCNFRNDCSKIVERLLQYGFSLNQEDKYDGRLLCSAVRNGYLKIVEDLLYYDADVNIIDNFIFKRGYTPLHIACRHNQREISILLINYGANTNAKDNQNKTPIFYAIENADLKMSKVLLINGANIKDSPELITIAVENECREIVEILLQYDADINGKNDKGKTAIFYAIENADVEITKLLLNNGADIIGMPELLHTAVKRKCSEIVEVLLLHGIDINAKDHLGKTPIFYTIENPDLKFINLLLTKGGNTKEAFKLMSIAAKKKCTEIIEILLKNCADMNTKDNARKTPIFYAIKQGDLQLTKLLLTNGADIKYSPEPLNAAVMIKSKEIVEILLQYGADINGKNDKGKTAIFYAIENGNVGITKLLLNNGADIIDMPELLHTAVKKKCSEIVEVLLQHGVDINPKDHVGKAPIYYAIKNADLKITRLLLTSGADIGGTPELLNLAIIKKYNKIVKVLLQHGVNINNKDHLGKTPIFHAVEGTNLNIIRLLLTNGADMEGIPELLHIAVKKKCSKVVEVLLQYGADINAKDDLGKAPIYYAIKSADVEIVKKLLICKADIRDNPELLTTAVKNKCREIVSILLQYGANINVKDHLGKVPIVYAIENVDSEIIRLLLNSGADINSVPQLLSTAIKHKCKEIITILLAYGADINTKDHLGKTPIYHAIKSADVHIVMMLLSNGADIKGNPELLSMAVMIKSREIVEILLQYGADINGKNDKGKTAIFYAIENGNVGITKLLLNNGADIIDMPELLHTAVKKKCSEIVEVLLQHGVDINPKDHVGKAPIYYAIKNVDLKITRLLLTSGADIGGTPELLNLAIIKKYNKIVKVLLQHGVNINNKDHLGKTPIFHAVEGTNLNIIRLLLTNGADMEGIPELLHIAVKKKCSKVVEVLLQYGADINAKDDLGKAPIYYAIKSADAEIVKKLLICKADIRDNPELLTTAVKNKCREIVSILLQYGANINVKDHLRKTPVYYAVENADLEMTMLLLTNGANIQGIPALLSTAVKKECRGIVEILLRYGADINTKDRLGKTPIFYAIENNDLKMTTLFLTTGADVSGMPELLHIAVKKKCSEIVEILLQHGANTNTKDHLGKTPIFYAIMNTDLKITVLLLTYGANINSIHGLLNIAVRKRCKKIVKILLQYGADINAKDDAEETAIFYAIDNADLEITMLLLTNGANIQGIPALLSTAVKKDCRGIVQILLQYGADINTKDRLGKTPIFYAIENNDLKMTRLFLTNGADISGIPELLHTAVKKKCREIVEVLLQHGADINAKDHLGKAPIFYAIKNADIKMVKLLGKS